MKKWFKKHGPRIFHLATIASLILASVAGRKWN
jgi:hypothetical protein